MDPQIPDSISVQGVVTALLSIIMTGFTWFLKKMREDVDEIQKTHMPKTEIEMRFEKSDVEMEKKFDSILTKVEKIGDQFNTKIDAMRVDLTGQINQVQNNTNAIILKIANGTKKD